MHYRIPLSADNLDDLNKQDPSTASDGGFQGLLVKLQGQVDRKTNELWLDDTDVERIRRYSKQYGDGGWQGRLLRGFVDKLDSLQQAAAA